MHRATVETEDRIDKEATDPTEQLAGMCEFPSFARLSGTGRSRQIALAYR